MWLRRGKRVGEAEVAMAEAAKSLLGLDLEMLRTLPADTVRDLCSPAGVLDPGRCLVTAQLFDEHGTLEQARGNENEAYRSWTKALFLYIEVLDTPEPDRIPDYHHYVARTDELLGTLSGFELGSSLRSKIFSSRV